MCRSNQLYDTVDNNLIAYGVDLTDLSSSSGFADTITTADATGKAQAGSGDVIRTAMIPVQPMLQGPSMLKAPPMLPVPLKLDR